MRLDELAGEIGAEVVGDGALDVASCATLDDAQAGQLSFLANPKYAKQLETTRATAVIVGPGVDAAHVALLRAGNPYYAFLQAMVLLHGHRRHPFAGVHPRAFVDPTATVGEGTVVYPGAFVGPRVSIGRECIIYPNATIYDDTIIGDRVIVHAGAVIGADGFGFASVKGVHHKIPQVGNVVIEDDVEIGANACIDRATLGSTVIGKGSKIDDLVMVAHNVRVGEGALLVAQVGIAGSTRLGHHATIGGQTGVAGHLTIGDHVTIAAQSGVTNNVPDQTALMGAPAMPITHARRVLATLTQLPELVKRIQALEQKVEELGGD